RNPKVGIASQVALARPAARNWHDGVKVKVHNGRLGVRAARFGYVQVAGIPGHVPDATVFRGKIIIAIFRRCDSAVRNRCCRNVLGVRWQRKQQCKGPGTKNLGELHGGPQFFLAGVVQEDSRRSNHVFLAILYNAAQVFILPIHPRHLRAVEVILGRRDAKHAGQQRQRNGALGIAKLPEVHRVEQVGQVPGFVAGHVEHGRNGLPADEHAAA
nr:hypothetical protein [Tanacetum cinerariifolium]